MEISVKEAINQRNEQLAAELSRDFTTRGMFVVNVMGAPGVGKTSALIRVIERLGSTLPAYVIEGDIESDIDTRKLAELGIRTVQINTGGACHLDSPLIAEAAGKLPLERGILFIENIGNLVCPAEFMIGEHVKLLLTNVTEGSDKPYKYPLAFEKADAILLGKLDLLPYVDFDEAMYLEGIRKLNPFAPVFRVSAKTGEGFDEVTAWLTERAKFVTGQPYFLTSDANPTLTLHQKQLDGPHTLEADEVLETAVRELHEGKIMAVKGLGGYHFACSPYDREAVDDLRKLKRRDGKPFAVMFHDIDKILEVCEVGDKERELLLSPARPIVLLPLKENTFAESVLAGSNRCGCFLPYTALHTRLLEQCGALIMTSANRSGSAIVCDDEEMLAFLRESDVPRFSSVLPHNRQIVRPVEDSVVQLAGSAPQILRWSRGYAPGAMRVENRGGQDLLAMGGDLKAAFCFVKGEQAYRSQYFGDLEEHSSLGRYAHAIPDFEQHFGIQPSRVLCDLHPGYHSSALAEKLGLPVTRVQHHHAHIASVMAEHDLTGKVIGVALDGTGYGDDGHIWGGEFLVCEADSFTRAGHLISVGLVGGDSAAEDAGKTALCYLLAAGEDIGGLCKDDDILRAALASGVNVSQSSSMGRLFDAVTWVLGVCDRNRYEGECAIRLQQCAEAALKAGIKPHPLRFWIDQDDLHPDAAGLVREIFSLRKQVDSSALALGFHHAVAYMVRSVCGVIAQREACDQVALSGGVFQNALLLELVSNQLSVDNMHVYTNCQAPPNDGGIALGQAYVGGQALCV
jgi:hydrogenase maturation protein HypF